MITRTQLTQKHTGRIYLSMDEAGFLALRELINTAEAAADALRDDEKKIVHLVTSFETSAWRRKRTPNPA